MTTADWNKLKDCFYRKRTLYDMVWNAEIDLSKFLVAGASFGGPIALVKDSRSRVVVVHSQKSDDKSLLYIFSSSGVPMASIQWNYKVVSMSWSAKERLVCVLDDGNVLILSMHGELLNTFSLGSSFQADKVGDCFIWSTGLVARTAQSYKFVAITNFDQPRVFHLPDLHLERPPRCISVVELSAQNGKGISSIQVLVSLGDGRVVTLNDSQWEELNPVLWNCEKICVSPNGRNIAFFNDEGMVSIVSTSSRQVLSEKSTKSKIPPLEMVWCGNDAVLLYWPQILLLLGSEGDFIKYSYEDSVVHLVPEIDGVRIISSDQCEFLHKVPTSTQKIFEIGSVSPSAMLYDATEAFENQSAKADEIIRSIQDPQSLENAISSCIEAAGTETDTIVQCRLLKAASYGKLFLTEYDSQEFVQACRRIRVLNSIRDYKVGIPLTMDQFVRQGPEMLVERLTVRHNHILALRICQYLKLSPNRVLVNWACEKMNSSDSQIPDEVLAKEIISKLEAFSGISYAEMANSAFRMGRNTLATLLLDREPKSSDQVPLLISMKLDARGLVKAIASKDTDLMYLVILGVLMRDETELFRMIVDKPLAQNLLVSYCKRQDRDLLKRFYFFMQQPENAALLAVVESCKATHFQERIQNLDVAKEFFLTNKVDLPSAKLVEEHIALLDFERKLELRGRSDSMDEKSECTFMNLSVSELIVKLISLDRMSDAIVAQKQFKVPAKRFMHLQVKTLSEMRRWGELSQLISGRRVPVIGFVPFVEACLKHHNKAEASRYIKLLPDSAEQMEWFCNIGLWSEAVLVAAADRNKEALETIAANCTDSSVRALVAEKLNSIA